MYAQGLTRWLDVAADRYAAILVIGIMALGACVAGISRSGAHEAQRSSVSTADTSEGLAQPEGNQQKGQATANGRERRGKCTQGARARFRLCADLATTGVASWGCLDDFV